MRANRHPSWELCILLFAATLGVPAHERVDRTMEFRKVKRDEFERRIGGTWLVGRVNATYEDLLEQFGLPTELFGDVAKVACAWKLIFSDGTGATIYSYGEISSDGHEIPEGQYCWHIGGTCTDAVDRVAQVLGTNQYEYIPGPPSEPSGGIEDIPF